MDDMLLRLRSWVDGESELRFAAVVDGKALKQQCTEAGASTATDGVHYKEALRPHATA